MGEMKRLSSVFAFMVFVVALAMSWQVVLCLAMFFMLISGPFMFASWLLSVLRRER